MKYLVNVDIGVTLPDPETGELVNHPWNSIIEVKDEKSIEWFLKTGRLIPAKVAAPTVSSKE